MFLGIGGSLVLFGFFVIIEVLDCIEKADKKAKRELNPQTTGNDLLDGN